MPSFNSMLRAVALCLLVTGVSSSPAMSQDLRPSWVIDFESPVVWQRVTSMGDLIVSTAGGLHGVDPATGTVVWTHPELANLSGSGFEEIAGAPLFMIDDNSDDRRVMILNAVDGKVVFDSSKTTLVEIQGKFVMPRSGSLLIVGFEKNNFNTQLFMYDLATGNKRWHNEVISEGMGKMTNVLLAIVQVAMDVSAIHADPVELEDGSFLLAAMGNVHRLDAATGEAIWKTEAGNARVLHMTDKRPGVLYVGSEEGDDSSPYYSTFQALKLDDGTPVWDKSLRVRGALNDRMISADQGLVVSERTEGTGRIRMLDYDTGQSLWGKKGKGIKVKGGIVDHDFSTAGMVITTGYDSAWNDKGTEYLLYVLDMGAGDLRFKKPLKVKGRMLQAELLPQGMLYVTSHEANIFDPSNGELLHKPDVRGKQPIVTASAGDYLYAYNTTEGELYRFDRSDGQLSQISLKGVELEGKDTPLELDVQGDQVIVTGRQNVVAFGTDGSHRFSAYHPAPRRSGLVQALMFAQAIRAAMAAVDYGKAGVAFTAASAEVEQGSAAHQLTSHFGNEFVDASESAAGAAADWFREARRRFQASAASRDFAFMMVQKDKKLALAQVSKQNGNIIAMIDLGKDREPSYQVDDVGDRIFYRQDPSVVAAYDFAPQSVASSPMPLE